MTTCLSPLILVRDKKNVKRGQSTRTDTVPCGKCPNCRRRRVQLWTFRLLQEKKLHKNSAFLTLTYNDENVIHSGKHLTLDKRDHQLFMKSLRRQLQYNGFKGKLKYYAVGEYGTILKRPHIHSILFGLPDLPTPLHTHELIKNTWNKGHVTVDPVTPASIAYVAGYVNKKLTEQEELPEEVQREWSLMSKGMGINFLTPQMKRYLKNQLNPYLTLEDGQKHPIPRYYKDKTFTDIEKNIINEKAKTHLEEFQMTPLEEYEAKLEIFRKHNQQIKIALHGAKL